MKLKEMDCYDKMLIDYYYIRHTFIRNLSFRWNTLEKICKDSMLFPEMCPIVSDTMFINKILKNVSVDATQRRHYDNVQ